MRSSRRRLVGLFMLLGGMTLVDIRVSAEEPVDPYAIEKAAIRQAAQEYVAAINRGDSQRIVAFWTPEGDVIDESGRLVKGRELARGAVSQRPDEELVERLAVSVVSIRFISADVAIEDGTAEVFLAGSDDSTLGRYTAVWVKRSGKWLLDSVRESTASKLTHHDQLRSLAWMIGEWREDSEDSPAGHVEMSCSWSTDENYLLREIRVPTPEGPVLSMSQRIGWDPAKKQIRAWTFGTDGSFGEAVYSRNGQRWIVAMSGVTGDGQPATSTNSYTRINNDTMDWESKEGIVGGDPVPDRAMRLVRIAADKSAARAD